ncbi:MAG: hypothetical protein AAF193_01840, partial [Bacteroidota bacterium]
MKIGLSIILILGSFLSIGQLSHVSLEVHDSNPDGLDEGQVVYRLYAHLLNDDDYVRGMIATNGCSPLSFGTSTSFYNHPLGGFVASPSMFIPAEIFPELLHDTYLTVVLNEDNSTTTGIQNSFLNQDSLNISNSFLAPEGSSFYVTDGGVVLNNLFLDPVGFPDDQGKVMLAQLTTDGTVSYQVNLEVYVEGDSQNSVFYYSESGLTCLAPANYDVEGMFVQNLHCSDETALNYNPDPIPGSVEDTEECIYQLNQGCMDPLACNYSQSHEEDDGSCVYPDGCTDSLACNYLPEANCDDGTCEYLTCLGCTNPLACNYDANAIYDDFSCLDLFGCTDESACNYAFWANCDNGSCEFASCLGCTDPMACNFDESATQDNGSCQLPDGCVDSAACNFSADANCDDGSCEYETCQGCTDPEAVNYDPNALIENGTCLYECDSNEVLISFDPGLFPQEITCYLVPFATPTDTAWSLMDTNGTEPWETCLSDGCYQLMMEDEFGDGWNNASISIEWNNQVSIHELEFGESSFDFVGFNADCAQDGCTNSLALNYNPLAIVEDGSCIFADNALVTDEPIQQLRLNVSGWQNT